MKSARSSSIPIHQLFSIRLRSTFRSQPPHFICSGGIQKEPQRVSTVPEEVLRSSANDYAIAGSGGEGRHGRKRLLRP
jgi:hypothetical protein